MTAAATIVLEYATEGNPFAIIQTYVESGMYENYFHLIYISLLYTGYHTVILPSAAKATDVQLQWRALRNAEWSLDNVRIGSDALLYNLQFDIQVGDCSVPPLNGSSLDQVSLEYYDGTTWSLLQNECLSQSRCLLMVRCNVHLLYNQTCYAIVTIYIVGGKCIFT